MNDTVCKLQQSNEIGSTFGSETKENWIKDDFITLNEIVKEELERGESKVEEDIFKKEDIPVLNENLGAGAPSMIVGGSKDLLDQLSHHECSREH
jgi:hypothetical protein